MTWVLQILDQNCHRSTTRLDGLFAAITASNENIARIGQLLTGNEQLATGIQGPAVTPVLQNPLTPVNGQPQYQGAPFQAVYKLAVLADQLTDIAWGLPPPPPIVVYQPQNVRARTGGQALNIQGANPVAPNFGLPQGPNIAQAQVPLQENNNEIYICAN